MTNGGIFMSFFKKHYQTAKIKLAALAKKHGKKALVTILVFFIIAVFSGGVLWWRLRSFSKQFITLPPITDPSIEDPINSIPDELVEGVKKPNKITIDNENTDFADTDANNEVISEEDIIPVSLEKPVWQWPSESKVLKKYGVVLWPTYEDWRMHDGIDIYVEINGYVKVAAKGIVSSITWDEKWGHVVEVKHGDNYTTHYKGEGQVLVTVNEAVEAGDNIMIIEKSCLAETALPNHIHFTIKQNGKTIDPESLLPTLS